MAKLKRTFLLGYSTKSVHKALHEQRKRYKKRIHELEEWNANFKRTIERYQEKELFISEALTEAKRLSRDILVDSQLKAEELVRLTEEDLSERVKNTESKLRELEDTKQTIIDHEEYMKVELRQLLNRQMEMVENIDMNKFHESGSKVKKLFDESDSTIENVKKIVNSSKAVGEDSGEIPTFSIENFK